MAKANKSGPTAAFTKANGNTTKQVVKAPSTTQMATSTVVNGTMIKQMVSAHTLIQMEPNIQVNGKMISNMVMVLRSGLMGRDMRVSIRMGLRLARAR